MDLNDLNRMGQTDRSGMIEHINCQPQQLLDGWQAAQTLPLPDWGDIQAMLIGGVGGSAIGGELVAAYAAPYLRVPLIVLRDYEMPAWAQGPRTLVLCSSHSGDTEETLSIFEQALAAGCRLLAVTSGGQLAAQAAARNCPLWLYQYEAVPRAALGYSFALQLAILHRLGLIPDPQADLQAAASAMQAQQHELLPEVPDTGNPAKRLAGQLMGRWVTIFGAGFLGPVARRWKCQINENAKAQAAFEILPEADHNALEGIQQPLDQSGATMNIFLRAKASHARNQLRDEFTRMDFMLQGQNTDFYKCKGAGRLAQMWTALHFGDYVSYYLAIAYGIDPTPVPMMDELKRKLRDTP